MSQELIEWIERFAFSAELPEWRISLIAMIAPHLQSQNAMDQVHLGK